MKEEKNVSVFPCCISYPEGVIFQGDVTCVTCTGVLGDIGIYRGHTPFVSELRPGEVMVDLIGDERLKWEISVEVQALVEVLPDNVRVVLDRHIDKKN